jgi:proton-translocating NADH-quinone oxidoreductase chain M
MILTLIFSILIFSLITLLLVPDSNRNILRFISLISSGFVLILSCFLLIQFDCNSYYFQNIVTYKIQNNIFNLVFSFGLDGVSISFFSLSSFLVFLCILFVWDSVILKEYVVTLLAVELFLLLVFSALDLLVFYMFFEAILIPMYLIIGIGGSRERKIRAAYLFFFYTLVGSLLLLLGILYILVLVGTLHFEYLLVYNFSFEEQCGLWLAFFLSFASKVPIFPFHIWLPEAHVEAPTVGSVLLAGILLKLGVYGFLRFSLTLFPLASLHFSPLVYLLCSLGVVYSSLCAIRQTDLKRIIAYSSIGHMNLVTLGIFSFNIIGLEGSILQSISHGFVSSALFLLIGVIYDRYHSRFIYYYGGLAQTMPIYSVLLFISTLANISVPGTSSFVGEFLLLSGIYKISITACVAGAISIILGGAYSLWFYNKLIFGNLKVVYTLKFKDVCFREFMTSFPLLFLVFFMGLYPYFFSNFIHVSASNLSLNYFYV